MESSLLLDFFLPPIPQTPLHKCSFPPSFFALQKELINHPSFIPSGATMARSVITDASQSEYLPNSPPATPPQSVVDLGTTSKKMAVQPNHGFDKRGRH